MKRAIALAAAALGVGACALEPPLDRTNPFDPWSPYPMTLVGAPDTAYSIGEEFNTFIERTPPIPSDGIILKWEVTDPNDINRPVNEVQSMGDGRFRITSFATAQFRTYAIAARFTDYIYQVVVGRNIVVGQRVAALQVSCIPGPCDAITPASGTVITLATDAEDALGGFIRGIPFAMARASIVSRDPAVVRPDSTTASTGRFHLTAGAPGTTWVVVTMDVAVDSVQLTVGTP
jgi:hypothetical protein